MNSMGMKDGHSSFGKADRFVYGDQKKNMSIKTDPSPFIQSKVDELIMNPLKNKRGVFKSHFKDKKNSIEINSEYGDGLMKIIQQCEKKKQQDNVFPGPGDYSPSFSFVKKKTCASILSHEQPISHKTSHPQKETLMILVENKLPKIAMLPPHEDQEFIRVKPFTLKQPTTGIIRKSKITKNIFDLAKENEYTVSPREASIELFQLRQKYLFFMEEGVEENEDIQNSIQIFQNKFYSSQRDTFQVDYPAYKISIVINT